MEIFFLAFVKTECYNKNVSIVRRKSDGDNRKNKSKNQKNISKNT